MNDFRTIVDLFLGLIESAIPVVFALTVAVIFWKITKAWIIDRGSPQSIEAGRQTLLIGVIALVIMSSIWGILQVLRSSLF